MNKRQKLFVYGSTGLWLGSATISVLALVCLGACYLLGKFNPGGPITSHEFMMLALGFVPWFFAYAATRVLYGIEAITEG